jgi:hypothetical protein
MTIDKRDKVTIPKWAIIVILPLIFGLIGGGLSSMFALGRSANQIEVNTKRLDVVEESKVDNTEFKIIENSLIRIENKLDQHLLVPTKSIPIR